LIISWQQACADAYTKDLLMVSEVLCKLRDKFGVEVHLYGWHMGKDYPDRSKVVRDKMPFAKFIEYKPIQEYIRTVVPVISKSDIFIMPYADIPERWGKSGFGLKRIMLMGIPVVVSDTQHHRELITHGKRGFLVSTQQQWLDSLKTLVKDKKLREKFSINSRRFMEEKYNDEAITDSFIDAVNKHLSLFA
jgi:glycosyltransferase involved in cell wall biosynthesis